MDGNAVRPTKKQRALLDFIEQFIAQHGYSPSYREIMNGCNYNSIATVAVHIKNLINRGQLRKRDHSARSLEVIQVGDQPAASIDEGQQLAESWLALKVDGLAEQLSDEQRETVMQALHILGLQAVAEQLTQEGDSLSRVTADNVV